MGNVSARLVLTFAVFISSAPHFTFAQEPSMEVTGKYLVEKINGLSGSVTFRRGGVMHKREAFTISNVSFDNCILSYTRETTSTVAGHGTNNSSMTWIIPVKEIDLDSVKLLPANSNPTVNSTAALQFLVKKDLKVGDTIMQPNASVMIQIADSQESKAVPLERALKHAATLCGGTKEPF